MDIGHDEYDRILFFELARKNAEAAYAINPLDADNITRWGRSLIELSQFQSGLDCVKMLEDGVLRLEEALRVEPGKHDTLWCLGNAHTSHAFYIQDQATAKIYFDKSTQCFQQAVEADPGNEMYHKSLDLSSKAPELHLELQRQIGNQQASVGGSSKASSKKQKKSSDLKYDILGWVILAVGIVAWVGMAKSHVPPPPGPL